MNRDNLISICSIATGTGAAMGLFLEEISTFLGQHYQNYEIVLIGNGINGFALAEARRLVVAVVVLPVPLRYCNKIVAVVVDNLLTKLMKIAFEEDGY